MSASKRVANKLPGGVEGHVRTVLHDDVYRRADDKRDERRYTQGGSVSLIFIAKVMKHGRYRYPCHAEAEAREHV